MVWLKQSWRTWSPIVRRVWREAWLPLSAGVVWAVYARMQGKTVYESLSALGVAFFFILFAQGQVLRIAKNVRDENDAEEFRDSFATLRQGLDELRKHNSNLTVKQEAAITPIPAETADDLMADAKRVFASGSYYAAATLASIAFEKAVRDALPDDHATRLSMSAILNLLTLGGQEGEISDLKTLIKLRNNLVHAGLNPIGSDKIETEELLNAFQNGITRVRALGK